MRRALRMMWMFGLPVGLAAPPARGDDKAIAQQAFQEGRALMAAGKIAEACPKFAAAAQLSQTAGVRLNLADCYAKLGKTASAWAKANEALSLAERTGDASATALARDQMSALQPKLSYLTIVVASESAPQGLEVALDGERIPAAVWGTALPVDPGEHEITGTAPGRKPARLKTTVSDPGTRATLSLPTLLPSDDGAQPAAAAAQPAGPATPPAPEGGGSSWSTTKTLAVASGALGLVGLGIGAGFGLDAAGKKSDYQQHQVNGACVDPQCVSISQDAVTAATVSTVGFIAGGVLLATGAVLWIAAPGAGSSSSVAIVPLVDMREMGASLAGRW